MSRPKAALSLEGSSYTSRIVKTPDENYPYIDSDARIELDVLPPRLRAFAGAHVMKGAMIGSDCKLGERVFVESGCRLDDRVTVKNGVDLWRGVHLESGVFVGPSVVFTNVNRPRAFRRADAERYVPSLVAVGATLGAGVVLRCGSRVGPFSMIGAGSLVLGNPGPFELWVGSPAKKIGWACACGETFQKKADLCGDCGTRYEWKGESPEPANLPEWLNQWYQQSSWWN